MDREIHSNVCPSSQLETKIRFNGCQRNESLIPKFAESIKEDKYLNTLPRRGGGWRKKRPNENLETKVRHEGRNGGAQGKGDLTAQNAFEEHQKRSRNGKMLRDFFFLHLGWKMNGDCRTKLAAGTVVLKVKQEPAYSLIPFLMQSNAFKCCFGVAIKYFV
ncbi:hypothetical protein TNCV_2789371 [Trichonephila clavipes]|nr:hypothetical protein TNCV_2789371 [Trichonephila clavipes]